MLAVVVVVVVFVGGRRGPSRRAKGCVVVVVDVDVVAVVVGVVVPVMVPVVVPVSVGVVVGVVVRVVVPEVVPVVVPVRVGVVLACLQDKGSRPVSLFCVERCQFTCVVQCERRPKAGRARFAARTTGPRGGTCGEASETAKLAHLGCLHRPYYYI